MMSKQEITSLAARVAAADMADSSKATLLGTLAGMAADAELAELYAAMRLAAGTPAYIGLKERARALRIARMEAQA